MLEPDNNWGGKSLILRIDTNISFGQIFPEWENIDIFVKEVGSTIDKL